MEKLSSILNFIIEFCKLVIKAYKKWNNNKSNNDKMASHWLH